jgi:hypothetical protein
MIRPHSTPTWADEQLAALRERHPDWDLWHVPSHTGPAHGAWCARPAGAMTATCQGPTPDEITQAITDYEARLPEHIATARAELRAPALHDDRRNVLQRQLDAMTRLSDLRDRTAAAPPRQPPDPAPAASAATPRHRQGQRP